jgi:hypothetical protein
LWFADPTSYHDLFFLQNLLHTTLVSSCTYSCTTSLPALVPVLHTVSVTVRLLAGLQRIPNQCQAVVHEGTERQPMAGGSRD